MPGCHQNKLTHHKCHSALSWLWSEVDENGEEWHIWEQDGLHPHERPPTGSRLSEQQQDLLDKQLIMTPRDTSIYQLRTGSSAPGSVPLYTISPALANPGTARYHVRRSREELGLAPAPSAGGLGFLGAIAGLNERLKDKWIISSQMHEPTYICLQNPFMRLVLERAVQDWLREDEEGVDGSSAGRHGIITDADEKYFRQGVLLNSTVFNPVTKTYMPVAYTWIRKVDTEHHRPHFHHLFKAIREVSGERFDKKLLFNVSIYTVI